MQPIDFAGRGARSGANLADIVAAEDLGDRESLRALAWQHIDLTAAILRKQAVDEADIVVWSDAARGAFDERIKVIIASAGVTNHRA